MTRSRIGFSILIVFLVFCSFPAFGLEPLSEDELYDTSGQASPTVSIKYSDNYIVDYWNQNVVVFEPTGEVSIQMKRSYWGDKQDDGTTNYITMVWPKESKFYLEFDKYPNYPNGIGVSVSDILQTGPDGKPLSYDPTAPAGMPANISYLRTKPAPATIRTLDNLYYIALASGSSGEEGEPDWVQAENHGKLLYIFNSGSQRVEILGYAYVWGHPDKWGLSKQNTAVGQ